MQINADELTPVKMTFLNKAFLYFSRFIPDGWLMDALKGRFDCYIIAVLHDDKIEPMKDQKNTIWYEGHGLMTFNCTPTQFRALFMKVKDRMDIEEINRDMNESSITK